MGNIRWQRWCLTGFAALALGLSATAHETDQYTLPHGRQFADLGDYFTRWAYDAIAEGVRDVNERQARDRTRGEGGRITIEEKDDICRAVFGAFPNAYDVIEGLEKLVVSSEMRAQYPGQLVGFKEQFGNIYQNVHFPLDPRQFFRIWHGSTMYAYGSYFGADKIGHFTDMGRNYYKEYVKAIKDGKSEEQAVRAAIGVGTHGALFSERGMVGYLSAGAYSNGDMAANYLGFIFYKNLTDEVVLEGRRQPPILVRENGQWKIAPHITPESDFFDLYITDHYNEVFNPSHFESGMRDQVRKAVKERTAVILARYCDQHGNRLPKSYFDEKAEEFRTYFGVDYGHRGPRDELVTVGNTCFESFPADVDVNARDNWGRTPLHVAAASSDRDAVRRLLERGADANAVVRSGEFYSAEWGNTPLHYAARDGRREIAEMLIKAGANVNAQNDRGQTPLHRALNHSGLVDVLLRNGAQVNLVDEAGQAPLHWAAGDGLADAAERLCAGAANPNAPDHAGQTPLHLAAASGKQRTVTALLDRGADVTARNHLRITPLHAAAAQPNPAVVQILIDHGADLAAQDDFGCRPIHEACRRGSAPVLSVFLERKADVNAADARGVTPLHLACRNGESESVALLIAAGADVKAKNHAGATALHEAAFSGDRAVISRLVTQGVEATARDLRGRTAIDIANARGHRDVVSLLRGNGRVATRREAATP